MMNLFNVYFFNNINEVSLFTNYYLHVGYLVPIVRGIFRQRVDFRYLFTSARVNGISDPTCTSTAI